jgi:hypothetical protein
MGLDQSHLLPTTLVGEIRRITVRLDSIGRDCRCENTNSQEHSPFTVAEARRTGAA